MTLLDRRSFIKGLCGASASLALGGGVAHAIGEGSLLEAGLLRYDGQFNPRPNGIRRMLQEVEKRTSIAVSSKPAIVNPADPSQLFVRPLLFWGGDRSFEPLSEAARSNLSAYLGAGGTIVVDSAEGKVDGPFEMSIRREMAAILRGRRWVSVPRSHVLYKSFYLIPDPVGRVAVARKMEGIFSSDRALVLMSHNDLMGAWSRDNIGQYEYDVFPGGDSQREMAYRLGINLVMYALCLNYKEDQVHVPFILKRRRWKVD